MRAVSLYSAPIPSPATLRYLRIQADTLRLFAPEVPRQPTSLSGSRLDCRRTYHPRRQWQTCSTRASRLAPRQTLAQPSSPRPASSPTKPASSQPCLRAFTTARPLLQPREVARRSTPWDKWQLRRPPAPNGSSPPTSTSTALTSFLDDTSTLGPRLSKPSPDVRLRCTEFDGAGNVTLVNGEFKKSELIQKYGLQPRDLRKIDSSLLPTILVRPKAILMNLLHIRCLIQADRVLVFDAYGSTDSYTQSLFMYDLEGKLSLREGRQSGALPYEFRALEAVLISVTTALEGEFEGVRGPVVGVLRELEENIDRDKLRLLLVLSKKLGTFEQRARLVRDAIDELLEADDDLASMYLTEKKEGRVRSEEDHTEVEMLLESYDKVCDEIVQVSGNLVSNIRNTEEIVKAILDANRNSLMLLDLKFSIGTLGIGAGTFIAALYGMNLKSFIEEWDFGFPLVSLTCAIFTAIACVYGLRKLRKVQRLSMWGEGDTGGRHSKSGRRPWKEEDVEQEGRAGWRDMDHIAEKIEHMEKNQWRTAERLRRMRMLDREDHGPLGMEVAGSKGPGVPAKI